MRSVCSIVIVAMLTFGIGLHAEVLNVPDDVETIQGGINAAEDGDTVLVQPGIYVENIDFNGNNITVASLFLMTGDTAYIESTVIDGDSSGTVVTFDNGESEAALLTGFTIRNGGPYNGGGIKCYRSSPTLANLRITENASRADGGGIYCERSSPTLTNLRISENESTDGGGIYCRRSSPTLTGVTITGNTADDYGGGFYCTGESSPTLTDVTISRNTAIEGGGGGLLCTTGPSPTLANVRISENTARTSGGGIFFGYDTSPILTDVTISGNSARDGGGILFAVSSSTLTVVTINENSASVSGGGIHCYDSNLEFVGVTVSCNTAGNNGGGIFIWYRSEPVLVNSIFWRNPPQEIYFADSGDTCCISIFYSDIYGGRNGIRERRGQQDEVIWGEGNINTNPLFVDPDNGDFRLTEDSPCIDAGDPDGELDPDSTRADMGAFYFHQPNFIESGGESLPQSFGIVSIYPNPFNATVSLSYILPQPGVIQLAVFNLAGRRVALIENGFVKAGIHRVTWAAENYSSGIYCVRMKTQNFCEIRKIILAK